MIDLNQFYSWTKESSSRKVKIEIEGERASVWAWDTKYMTGQIVQSVDEIDLRNERIKDYKRKLEELKELEDEANANPTANLQQANRS